METITRCIPDPVKTKKVETQAVFIGFSLSSHLGTRKLIFAGML
jgi:hypothetical protein